MKRSFEGISFDTVLFLIFSSLVILSREGTSMLVTFSSLSIFSYLLIDFFVSDARTKYMSKLLVIVYFVSFVIISTAGSAMYLRAMSAPHLFVHDNPPQVESALSYLLEGKNPYTEDYFGTPLERWPYFDQTGRALNPALYHLISLPSHLFISLPFYIAFNHFFHWYDQRIVYLVAFFTAAVFLTLLTKDANKRLVGLILFGSFSNFLHFLAEGRNDILVFSLIIAAVYFLKKEKLLLSVCFLALATTTKHSAWFMIPFYFAYIFFRASGTTIKAKIRNVLMVTWPFFVIVSAVIIPFLLWDASSFIEDIYSYPAGTLVTSYPMKGVGLAGLISESKYVDSSLDYFPFWIPQVIFGLPLLLLLLWRQSKRNTLANLMTHYLFFTLVVWYFSRFFVGNYLVFITQLAVVVYMLEAEREQSA